METTQASSVRSITIPVERVGLQGDLVVPRNAQGIVLFAHGSGSGRKSSRNRFVAQVLQEAGLTTLLFDLLTLEEEEAERFTAHLRFDIPLLTRRLIGVLDWLSTEQDLKRLRIGIFGASTGAAAALLAAAERSTMIQAVVSRGGRPDLAMHQLDRVAAPTLLIVGGADREVLTLNREALARLHCEKKLETVAGATHLFEEPGALDAVAAFARDWFVEHLAAQPAAAADK